LGSSHGNHKNRRERVERKKKVSCLFNDVARAVQISQYTGEGGGGSLGGYGRIAKKD